MRLNEDIRVSRCRGRSGSDVGVGVKVVADRRIGDARSGEREMIWRREFLSKWWSFEASVFVGAAEQCSQCCKASHCERSL